MSTGSLGADLNVYAIDMGAADFLIGIYTYLSGTTREAWRVGHDQVKVRRICGDNNDAFLYI